jgi:transcriptional regulator with XRE-family HTH domain
MTKSAFTPAYKLMLSALLDLRRQAGVNQIELAKRLGKQQAFVSNFERGVRRLDLIEFYAIVRALGGDPVAMFADLAAKLPKKVAI